MSQGYNKFKRFNNNYSGKPSKPCVNPIFERWLLEWREDATQKNSKMQFVYSKALGSLRKYPLVLRSGKECKLLEFFGDGLCKMIDNRMSKEPELFQNDQSSQGSSSSNPLAEVIDLADSPPPSKKSKPKSKAAGATRRKANENNSGGSQSGNSSQMSDEEPGPSRVKKPKKTKSYLPPFKSGGYAILLTLFKKETCPNFRGMLKSELISEAQHLCESSFTRPEQVGSHYTAWNSMSTLVKKELVIKQGNPVRFMLTVEGRELAGRILKSEKRQNGIDTEGNGAGALDSHESQEDDDDELQVTFVSSNVTLNPGEFDIILYVDTGETSAKCKKEEVIDELRKNGVALEVQRLNIGDFVWVLRERPRDGAIHRRLTVAKGSDLVLPFVVERKRADDLAHSIKDTRYNEQKLRLSQSGLKPIYLVESHGRGDWGLGEGALTQALVNTQIVNEFLIHETSSIKHTCAYLTHMTRHLTKMYQNKRIYSCTREEWPTKKLALAETYLMKFNDFNEFAVKTKNWTVTEMFAKHIMRLRGLSAERAQAIIEKYPTLHALLRAYRHCATEKERETLLAPIYFGNTGRTIGPAISKAIYKLYTLPTLL